MNTLTQRLKDWYVLGPRDFYRRYVENFPKRRGLAAVSGDHGFLDMNPLPLGYAERDEDKIDAMRRRFQKGGK